MENKPTMAFVEYDFHKKTKSADFLKELLSPHFEIVEFLSNNSWTKGCEIPIKELNKYDYIFFDQIIPSFKNLEKIKSKIIWSPMYDGVKLEYFYWKQLSFLPIKIISFSKKVHSYCQKFNIDSTCVQYHENPNNLSFYKIPETGNHIFFWYRGNIKFEDIKKIINHKQVDSFIYKSNPDPKFNKENIRQEDIKKYKIKMIEKGYIPESEYYQILSQTNIFIAPRKKEGIGMSFLKPISMGHCIIANDESTMNEYITDKKNGYLFNIDNPQKIDISNNKILAQRSKEKNKIGFKKWQKDKKNIIDFILKKNYNPMIKNKFIQITFKIIFMVYPILKIYKNLNYKLKYVVLKIFKTNIH